ncbi:MAG: hypothetical protein KME42_17210 [Tildeniella nuda ZEHNDER 1965/U140]|jgi:hypothetical protein|nr:hypothetical protein [Tildeniella nuda ZEHNDER 1965/U140]
MKSTEASEPQRNIDDDLLPEYEFDYRKARPNRFVTQTTESPLTVELAPDVAEMFPDAAAVNEALRFLIRMTKNSSAHS